MTPRIFQGFPWYHGLRKRVPLQLFRRVGMPPPSFFFTVNEQDSRSGVVVDIVSGATASSIGSPVLSSIRGGNIDGSIGGAHVVPCVDLGSSGGLNFGQLPLLVNPANEVVILSGTILVNNTNIGGQAGNPTLKIRGLLSRSFANPGGTLASMSGWTLGVGQHKVLTSDTSYQRIGLYYKNAFAAAVYTSTYYGESAAYYIWASTYYPFGDTYLKSFTMILRKVAGVSGVEQYQSSPRVVQKMFSATGAGVNTSYGCPITDISTRDVLVGCTRDENTDSFYTNFLDGKIVSLGLWSLPDSKQWEPTTNVLSLGRGVGPFYNNKRLLQSIATEVHEVPESSPPPTSKTYYVSSAKHADIPLLEGGKTYGVGNLVRSAGRVFRVVQQGGAVLTVPTFAANVRRYLQALDTGAGNAPMIVTEVTGEERGAAASNAVYLVALVGGDTVIFLDSHKPALASGVYLETVRARFDGLGRAGLPVIVKAESPIACPDGIFTLRCDNNIFVDNLGAVGKGIQIVGFSGVTRVEGLYCAGGTCEVTGAGVIELYECKIRPIMWWGTEVSMGGHVGNDGLGTLGVMPKWDSYKYSYSAFGNMLKSSGGSIRMFGGEIAGVCGELGSWWGGASIYEFGVAQKDRQFYREAIDESRTYSYERRWAMNSGYRYSSKSKLVMVGGVPGRPYYRQEHFHRQAALGVYVDSLCGEGHQNTQATNNTALDGGYYGFRQETSFLVSRVASTARMNGRRYSYMLPSAQISPGNIFNRQPVVLAKYFAAGATSIRLYFLYAPATVLDPEIVITYVSSIDSRKLVKRTRYSNFTTTLADTWRTNYADGFGGFDTQGQYMDIPLPNWGVGMVTVAIHRLLEEIDDQRAKMYVDPSIEAV